MYKDPLWSNQVNKIASKGIDQKIEKLVEKLSLDTEQSDTDFMSNLYDLCVLNRMADSHDG